MSHEGEAGSSRWLDHATSDLEAAAVLLASDVGAGAACFLAQQSVEKALKGALVHAGADVPRIHNLDTLRNLLSEGWAAKQEFPDLAELTAWAIESRYPGDWPQPSIDDARTAVDVARAVVASIADELAARGLEGSDGEG